MVLCSVVRVVAGVVVVIVSVVLGCNHPFDSHCCCWRCCCDCGCCLVVAVKEGGAVVVSHTFERASRQRANTQT